MTVEAPAPVPGRGTTHWVDRWRLSWSQLNWLLRLAELPAVLALVALGRPDSHVGVLIGLLALTSGAWIAWLGMRSWRSDVPADGLAVLVLLLVIAVTSGLAAMVPGAGNAAILAAIVTLEAGTTLIARKAVTVAVAAMAGVAVGTALFSGPRPAIWLAFYAAALAGASLVGVARGLRREQMRQATVLMAREREAHVGQQRAATLAERARIAREIHDILAHSLTDLSIQLEAADALLTHRGDVTGAVRLIRHAHRLANDGLEETRRAVNALRSDAPPLPTTLAVLAGAHGRAELQLEGSPRPLAPSAGLALVRTAQEALVNARTHAPGRPVTVQLRYGCGRVDLTVTNSHASTTATRPAAPSGGLGGYGLAGMRERLLLTGGSLTAGPVPDGWIVHAEVPG